MAALALAVNGAVVVETARPAEARADGVRPSFQLPFPCGESWELSTYRSHDDYDVDMFASNGTTAGRPILAAAAGTVSYAGWDGGGGWHVQLNHGEGWESLYLHMESPPVVSTGQSVQQGQLLGKVGSTGNSSAPHLHHEQLREGAKVETYFNGIRSEITTDGFPLGEPLSPPVNAVSSNCGDISIYGILPDGRLTYSLVESVSGRLLRAMTSGVALGFTPKAMATLNFNTILLTSTEGDLYRVDVITNNESLVFNPPVKILSGGWTYTHLSYDGAEGLYGLTSAGVLRRHEVTAMKPAGSEIVNWVTVDSGFTLETLATTGPDWILGTVSDGRLMSYQINGVGSWESGELTSSTWQNMTHLLSPGAGTFFGRTSDGALHRYGDRDPYDNNGSDLYGQGRVTDSGWTEVLLSAQPFGFWYSSRRS
ncbi:M23 family metallopeptidase [Salinispora sp. H7-4]|uniref:M23 family metallopeptidase n=1 Tax=Salinispora sp. H7-4 TaxID=2748321 RepID=UPI0015D2F2BA|nr:M23 family metallopeptidase [Salinispora sp. H7-4]NYT94636.1 peptidoglycan DD-metalloendopeptidase family protein [Salinispora sp. H7-4]